MGAITYFQINLIPIAAMLILRKNASKTLSYSWSNLALRFVMVLVVVIMVTDTLAWSCNGIAGKGAVVILYAINTLYFVLESLCAFIWFLYVWDNLRQDVGQRGRKILPLAIPLVVLYGLLLLNLAVPIFFSVNSKNCYQRERGFWLYVLIAGGYMLGSAILGGYYFFFKRRQISLEIILVLLLPFLGATLQMLFFGIELLWPSVAAALMIYYISLQNGQVARDGLTGLNNRRRLDQYLEQLESKNGKGELWYFVIMDVDDFKKINDTYGHLVGDEVLRQVSGVIKKVAGNRESFLARYGGDEFAIVIKAQSEDAVKEMVLNLERELEAVQWQAQNPWKLSMSVGYAYYDRKKIKNMEQLIKTADERMYENKRKKKLHR